jgi:release factor glutamine methyltransferase
LLEAGVEFPRADAEWIMAAVLAVRRADLFLTGKRPLSAGQLELWEKYVAMRCRRVPLQHILGSCPFGAVDLLLSPSALIPRPETELLVQIVVERLSKNPPKSVLDLGTGCGACALAIGKAFPAATLTASDISLEALALAKRNGDRCQMADRINFVCSDWFSQLHGKWDLILSNPPYLSEEEWQNSSPEVRLGDPPLALLGGGADGADALKTIIGHAGGHLNGGGMLALEMGIGHGAVLSSLAKQNGLRPQVFCDFNGHERFLICRG